MCTLHLCSAYNGSSFNKYFIKQVPTWSPTELKAVPDAARVAAYRFGTAVRLLRNICLWNKILAVPVLEKIALNELLCGKILPHLHSIQTNVHEAMIRAERVVASLYDVWTGPSVTGDHRYVHGIFLGSSTLWSRVAIPMQRRIPLSNTDSNV